MTAHEREDYYEPPEIVWDVEEIRADPSDPANVLLHTSLDEIASGSLWVPEHMLPDGVQEGDEVTLTVEATVPTTRYGSRSAPQSDSSSDTVEYP